MTTLFYILSAFVGVFLILGFCWLLAKDAESICEGCPYRCQGCAWKEECFKNFDDPDFIPKCESDDMTGCSSKTCKNKK